GISAMAASQAGIWDALRLTGVQDRTSCYGRLLRAVLKSRPHEHRLGAMGRPGDSSRLQATCQIIPDSRTTHSSCGVFATVGFFLNRATVQSRFSVLMSPCNNRGHSCTILL